MRLRVLVLMLVTTTLMLMDGCAVNSTSVRPPVCLLPPGPTVPQLAQCYVENCIALQTIRGDSPAACAIK